MSPRVILAGAAALLFGAAVAVGVLYLSDTGAPEPVDGSTRPEATSAAVETTTATVTTTPSDEAVSSPGQGAGRSVELARALASMKAERYAPIDRSTYIASNELTALVGLSTQGATGTNQRAFFFVDGAYIGTDTSEPSAGIEVAFQTGNEVALSYRLYKASDANCCPTDGSATVRYRWNGDSLEPLDPIPPTDFDLDGSRR